MVTKLIVIASIAVAGSFLSVVSAKIPDYIHVCKRNDPVLEKCIRESIEHIRPKLKTGIRELDVPPIEPFYIPELVVIGRRNFRALGRNVSVTGASQFHIRKLKLDLPAQTYYVSITIPEMYFNAIYEIDARILVLPLKGKGPLKAKATNVDADGILKGRLVQRDGKTYMHFHALDLNLKILDYEVHLENLFNGDKVLGEATDRALNENKADFMRVAKPVVESTVSEIMLLTANKIVQNFEYDEIFPPN